MLYRPEKRDTGAIKCGQQLFGNTFSLNNDVRRNFDQRHKYKCALMHPWMRDGEAAFMDLQFIEKEDIQVEWSRAVFFFADTVSVSAMPHFDRVQSRQQIMW